MIKAISVDKSLIGLGSREKGRRKLVDKEYRQIWRVSIKKRREMRQ